MPSCIDRHQVIEIPCVLEKDPKDVHVDLQMVDRRAVHLIG